MRLSSNSAKKSMKRYRKTRIPTRRSKRVAVSRTVVPRSLPLRQEAHVKQLLKTLVNRRLETKYARVSQSQNHNSAIFSGADCYRLVPKLPKGTGDNQRVGDTVQPMYLKVVIKLRLSDTAYSGSEKNWRPIQARVLGLRQKDIKSWGDIENNGRFSADVLLKPNQETATVLSKAYTGDWGDNILPINAELFDCWMDRQITLTPQYMDLVSTPGPFEGTVNFPVLAQEYVIEKYVKCPSAFTYDESNATLLPNNFCPFVAVGYQYIDSSQPDTLATQINVTVASTLYYKDG